MARNMTINQLTEGIRERHLGAERNRLVEKWTRTGLLRGMNDYSREAMSQLLENQAAQLLREANTIGTSASSPGNLDGFTNIAFPIVRRVFGGLVANELVSIQPMSLPSGLLFYLDYTYGSDVGGDSAASGNALAGSNVTYERGQSLYNNPAGANVRTGSDAVGGQYDLVGTAYSKVHTNSAGLNSYLLASGAYGTANTQSLSKGGTLGSAGADGKLIQFDPQVSQAIDGGTGAFTALVFSIDDAAFNDLDPTFAKSFALNSREAGSLHGVVPAGSTFQAGNNILNIRRLNQLGTYNESTDVFTPNPLVTPGGSGTSGAAILCIVSGTLHSNAGAADALGKALSGSFVKSENVVDAGGGQGSTLVIPSFESNFASSPTPVIPEIDIKIESIAVTAATRKLRARWSPELAQDLNAYHSLDAEVELTQILSEQIALEIDREILNDLLVDAKF